MLVVKVEDLNIYKLAVKLRDEVYEEVGRIPFNSKNPDVQQIKRSASSSVANIAEGFGRRFYIKEFAHFLSYSIGSSQETPNHAFALHKDGLITLEKAEYFEKQYTNLLIKTIKFRNYLLKKQREA